jgi:hypothetical protein
MTSDDPRPDELDPIVLLWWMRRRVDFERIPQRRVVLNSNFAASVCLKNPGFEIDLIVSADIWAFCRVWLGRSTLAEALRREQVQLDGAPADVRSFPHWFSLSPMAETIRVAFADRRTASGKLVRSTQAQARQSARTRAS